MKKEDISVGSLVDMFRRGELQLPEIQRHFVWQAPRVRDLFDSLYRGYPSGSILLWETNEPVPTRDMAVEQSVTAFAGRRLLLDGQQRLTSLAAVMEGQPVKVRGRKRPVEILFNLDHPEGPPVEVVEVEGDEESPLIENDDTSEDEDDENGNGIAGRINRLTFVVASKSLEGRPNWVRVSEVFKQDSDAAILKKAGVTNLDDPRSLSTPLRQVLSEISVASERGGLLSHELFWRVDPDGFGQG